MLAGFHSSSIVSPTWNNIPTPMPTTMGKNSFLKLPQHTSLALSGKYKTTYVEELASNMVIKPIPVVNKANPNHITGR